MLLDFAIALPILFSFLIFYLWKRNHVVLFRKKINPAIPRPNFSLSRFFFGHTAEVFRNSAKEMHQAHLDLAKETNFPPLLEFYCLGQQILATTPESVLDVYSKKLGKGFTRHGNISTIFEPLTGPTSLSFREDQVWMKIRKVLNPAFSTDSIKLYMNHFDYSCGMLIEKLKRASETKEIIKMDDYFVSLTIDIICTSLTSKKYGFSEGKHTDVVKAVPNLFFLCMASQTPENMRSQSHWDSIKREKNIIDSFIYEMIQERKELLKENKGEGFQDLLAFMLKKDPVSDEFILTDEEIRDQIATFFVGGYDTIAHSLSWLIYILTQFKEVREKCRAEVEQLIGKDPMIKPTYNQLGQLKYVSQVIKETLRMYPALPLGRGSEATTDLKLNGVEIPKGTVVTCGQMIMHRNPNYWEDPDVFDEERFSLENQEKIPNGAYLPFALGPKRCIGEHFAVTEIKFVICMLLRMFDFEYIPTETDLMKKRENKVFPEIKGKKGRETDLAPCYGTSLPVLEPENHLPVRVLCRV